jgi:hypothetical protein
MRFDRLDLNLLVAFDVLGKEQNVSAVAKTCLVIHRPVVRLQVSRW